MNKFLVGVSVVYRNKELTNFIALIYVILEHLIKAYKSLMKYGTVILYSIKNLVLALTSVSLDREYLILNPAMIRTSS